MFTFFKRLRTLVGSELNALLDRAEDPVKMLDQFMREMETEIKEVESAVAVQMANEKMMKRKYEDEKSFVEKRDEQAMKALEAGDEDLARRTIADKHNHEEQMNQLNNSYEQASMDVRELKDKLEHMKNEYQEMKVKKDSLQARAQAAQTKTKVNRALNTFGSEHSKHGFERMEKKVLQYEAEAETTEEMKHTNHSLDDELHALEDNRVDAELARMKERANKHG
ncbi:phage-shock protein [Pontibacillus halophilus JSM 076056 = DSM 19796]|uniref:Phage-shock protein n=1 Tax=Pontibacillus halophilus JSM 076056 = DSM 19796 TaxID=1385510 RepID=A0A0A5IBZ3_9BACI|nr:PspA/IM30 family protein [Pontibacillus halophilus]KGX93362.1 phage-shock protein [Pontibacillus halophilus JSM 076056 = DSM 19796]